MLTPPALFFFSLTLFRRVFTRSTEGKGFFLLFILNFDSITGFDHFIFYTLFTKTKPFFTLFFFFFDSSFWEKSEKLG